MEAKFDLFEDEDPHPNLIYQCHEIASESSDVVYSKKGSAPPTPIKITRKQLKEPKSKEKFDELGFLSAYILEMAQHEEVTEENTQKQAQEVSGHGKLFYLDTCKPQCICRLSVPDFSSDVPSPPADGKKCNSATKKSVRFKTCEGLKTSSTSKNSTYKSEVH